MNFLLSIVERMRGLPSNLSRRSIDHESLAETPRPGQHISFELLFSKMVATSSLISAGGFNSSSYFAAISA
jgi:hypothetical protein